MEFRLNKPKGRPSKPNPLICKKHPKHQQSPGVCSVCLNEKLSQLATISRGTSTTTRDDSSCSSSSLSSLTSSHYSASASSCSSPVHRHHRHYGLASDGRGFSMTLFKGGKNVLTKSRSVAVVTRRRDAGGQADIDDHGKKKGGFWSKLLRPKNKGIDAGLTHSRTVNERVATKVH